MLKDFEVMELNPYLVKDIVERKLADLGECVKLPNLGENNRADWWFCDALFNAASLATGRSVITLSIQNAAKLGAWNKEMKSKE